MTTSDRDLGRLEGKMDSLLDWSTSMDTKIDGIKDHGCALGLEHSKDIENIFKKLNGGNGGSGDKGNWLQIGKLKAAGVPALIIAIFIGWAIYQHYDTRLIADEVKSVKVRHEQVISEQARALAKSIIAELKNKDEIP